MTNEKDFENKIEVAEKRAKQAMQVFQKMVNEWNRNGIPSGHVNDRHFVDETEFDHGFKLRKRLRDENLFAVSAFKPGTTRQELGELFYQAFVQDEQARFDMFICCCDPESAAADEMTTFRICFALPAGKEGVAYTRFGRFECKKAVAVLKLDPLYFEEAKYFGTRRLPFYIATMFPICDFNEQKREEEND